MEPADLLAEVSLFLRVTLAQECLSKHAESCRQRLIERLTQTQAYTDMNGGSNNHHPKIKNQNSDCYEELEKFSDINVEVEQNIPKCYSNNLYNNLSSAHKQNVYANNENLTEKYLSTKEDTYIKPTSPLANTPVSPAKPDKTPPSKSNSERNSIISWSKDSKDQSDSSSFTSSRSTESPEVLATSASALRYAATKSGTLGRRERFLFMDHTKFYWIAVLNQTLFVFASDKDSKPLFELDITGYKARPVSISNNVKSDVKFELVAPGKKTHQFTAEKQSDMEKWVMALNIVTKAEVTPLKELSRELPSLPQDNSLYDIPDSAKQPLIEPRYVVPESRAVTDELTKFFKSKKSPNGIRRVSTMKPPLSAKEGRELPLLPHQQQTYDNLDPTIRPVQPELYESLREEVYHFIDDHKKPVDNAVMQQMYDHPEPRIRPVSKAQEPISEEIYSVIDSNQEDQFTTQDAVYKNLEENRRKQEDESTYYNFVPYPETDTNCIYDVINEQHRAPGQYVNL